MSTPSSNTNSIATDTELPTGSLRSFLDDTLAVSYTHLTLPTKRIV